MQNHRTPIEEAQAVTDESNSTTLDPRIADRLKRDSKGLVAAVVQQYDSGRVLMVGYMNDEALRRTLTTGRVTFWSRSRQEYWRKGDTSGHVQYVKSVSIDCDGDALLVEVDQVGSACHTGDYSCFDAGGELPAVVGHRTPEQESVPNGPGAPQQVPSAAAASGVDSLDVTKQTIKAKEG